MIAGTMKSELVDNARVWTLTVPVQPQPGQLIQWSEPALGSIPAQSGIRGWVSPDPSTRPGTVLVSVPGSSIRWVIVNIQAQGVIMAGVPNRYYLATNTVLIRLANDSNDEDAYAELQDRAASAGCLISELPRSMEDGDCGSCRGVFPCAIHNQDRYHNFS